MVTVSIALLTVLVAAGPLFERATAAGVLERKLATIPTNTQFSRQPAVGVTVNGPLAPAAQLRISAMVDAVPGLSIRSTTLYSSGWRFGSDRGKGLSIADRTGVVWYRTGAVDALEVVSGSRAAKGVWLPEGLANDLRLKAGDRFPVTRVFGCGEDTRPCADFPLVTVRSAVTLAGTYRTRPGGRVPAGAYFTGIAAQLPGDPNGLPTVARMMIADRDTIDVLLNHARKLDFPTWTYVASLSPDARTPARLKQAAAGAYRLKVAGADPGSAFSRLMQGETAIGRIDSALPKLQEEAEADAHTAAQQGRGVGYAGGAVGLGAVLIALRALAQRRRRETELLIGLGTPMPVVLGASVLELLLPTLTGSAIGGAGAWLAFERFGPQDELGPDAVPVTVLTACLAAVLTLTCSAVVTRLQARSITREMAGRPASPTRGPWLPLLTGATVLAVGSTLARDGNGAYTDPLSTVLPILILACGCLVLVRAAEVVSALIRRLRRRSSPRSSPRSSRLDFLVLRGLRNTGVAVGDLVAILAIGIGVLAYGLVSAATVHAAVDDKAAVLAGADATAIVPHSYDLGAGEGAAPHLGSGMSMVWRATGQLHPDFTTVDVLVVNPDTLPAAARWGEGPDLKAARASLNLLHPSTDIQKSVPAVLVGGPGRRVGSGGLVRIGVDDIALTVRGNLKAFPGADGPTIVLGARSLFASLEARNPALNPSRQGATRSDYASWLWSAGSSKELARYLEKHSVTNNSTGSFDEALATPVLTSSGWAATYQILLGLVAATLAGLSVVVAVDRRVARAAPVDLVLRRFGMPPARLTALRAVEILLTGLGALVVLALPLGLVLALLPRLVEPGPALAPAMGAQVPLAPLLHSLLVTAVIVGLAALVAARRSAHLKSAEVLRDDQ